MIKNLTKEQNMQLLNGMRVTKHFIERYAERVLKIGKYNYSAMRIKVLEDLIERMTMVEKQTFGLLCSSNNLKFPLGGVYRMVICNKSLVTIY